MDPHFSDDDFEKQRSKLLTQLLQLKDEPAYLARVCYDKLIFNNSVYQYPITGYENDINSINKDEIIKSKILLEILNRKQSKTLIYAGTYTNIDNVTTLLLSSIPEKNRLNP
mgnify:CR=1 FL=1